MALPDLIGMSDLTKTRLVDVTLEFHQLQKLQLFTRAELCDVMEKLIHFQAKINGDNRCIAYCVEYIEYQLNLLKTIQLRALENPSVNKVAVERSIIDKIKQTYQEAIKEFTDDYSLHIPYVKFCIRINSKDDVVDWCIAFLQHDITNKDIWLILDDLYSNESDEIKSDMWIIMNDFADKFLSHIINEEVPQTGDEDPRVTKIGDLFDMAFKYIQCSYFHIALLDNLQKENIIMEQVLNNFRQNVYMWNALAQQLWRVDIKTEGAEPQSSKVRLEKSVAKYKEGITILLPENKSGLWCILLNFLFVVYADPATGLANSFKLSIIKTHLTEGMPYFSDHQFLKWLKLETDPKERLHISEKAVAILPNSVNLWRERLMCEFDKDDTSNARSLFYVAIGHLKEQSLPLWQDMIQYTILTTDQDSIEELYWEGVKDCHEVSNKLKPMFLEWLALHKGIKHTRGVYNLLVDLKPYSKEIHTMMSRLENILAEDFNEEVAERVHKIACSQFSDDVDVRLNYIQFLVGLNKRGIANLNGRVSDACEESLAALPAKLHEEFKLKFNDTIASSTM